MRPVGAFLFSSFKRFKEGTDALKTRLNSYWEVSWVN